MCVLDHTQGKSKRKVSSFNQEEGKRKEKAAPCVRATLETKREGQYRRIAYDPPKEWRTTRSCVRATPNKKKKLQASPSSHSFINDAEK